MCSHALLFPLMASMLAAQTQGKECRTVLFQCGEPGRPQVVQPGAGLDVPVTFGDVGYPVRRFLRVVGGVAMPAPFTARGEENFRLWEFYLDDSLDAHTVASDRYSLYFTGRDDDFERKAYHRIDGRLLKPGELTVSTMVQRAGFAPASDADFGVEIELFFHKDGRDRNDVYDPPDARLFMPIPGGDGPFTEIRQTFTLPENVAAAVVAVGGRRFSGACWVEAPRLLQGGQPAAGIPFVPFAERGDTFNYWVGCNLATRCWPVWDVAFNGASVFNGALFDRASNVADFYMPLPSLKGGGTLRVGLVPNRVAASFPCEIRSVELIEIPARDFEVCHSPRYIARGSTFGVLIETNTPDVRLSVEASGSVVAEQREVFFEHPGLHAAKFMAQSADVAPTVTLSDGTRTETVALGQIVVKTPDNIYLSVGDDIYADKNGAYFDEYFKWYAGQRMGNFYQFRPSYQWSGFRQPDAAKLAHLLALLQDLQMPYAWQVEGRTLAGKDMNPPLDVLASPLFHGKQAHENDGGYYYWQHFLYKGFFSDMAARTRPYGGIFAKHRPLYTEHGVFIHYDPHAITDMAHGARQLVENFRYSRGESTRHTGPSTLFRYLYQAGYDWLGAEQMYGPEETILSALRGASRAYHKECYGSLHAMQWGSFPYTDARHAERMLLSLAVAYMHGSSHLNTEDALWLDEFAHDRFSEPGKAHIAAQHQILDFIETHQRRGTLVSDIAIVQGRNDAWKSFGRSSLWSQKGDKWAFNKACESFDLLKIFYPQNDINACGPEGWFTSTPYGAVDIVPIEADAGTLRRYKTLVFLGWNTYCREDFVRLADFVREGGTLILSAAHLNSELAPELPPRLPDDDAPVVQLLGDGYRGRAEMSERAYGNGRVVYFPQPCYPAEPSITGAYTRAIRAAAETANAAQCARGWIAPDERVGFTVWDDGTRRTIYLLNVDWQSDAPAHRAELMLGTSRFPIAVRRGELETIHCAEGFAIMPANGTTDILALSNGAATVQLTAPGAVQVFNAATGAVRTVAFAAAGIHVIALGQESKAVD